MSKHVPYHVGVVTPYKVARTISCGVGMPYKVKHVSMSVSLLLATFVAPQFGTYCQIKHSIFSDVVVLVEVTVQTKTEGIAKCTNSLNKEWTDLSDNIFCQHQDGSHS